MTDNIIIWKLGRRIRWLREHVGVSQTQAAERVGIHRTSWVRLEKGDSEPTLSTVCRAAEALGVRPSDILCVVDASTRGA